MPTLFHVSNRSDTALGIYHANTGGLKQSPKTLFTDLTLVCTLSDTLSRHSLDYDPAKQTLAKPMFHKRSLRKGLSQPHNTFENVKN